MVNVYLIVEDKYINEMLGVTTIDIKSTVLPAPHAGQVAEHHQLELRPTADNPALQLRNTNTQERLWKTFISNLRRTKTGQS